MSIQSSEDLLPNLPGFKSSGRLRIGDNKKVHIFEYSGGQRFVKERTLPQIGSDEGSLASLSFGASTSNISKALDEANLILTFQAYFEEIATSGPELDQKRVRKCNVYFHVDDQSLMIVERPQMNSGIPQGTLVKKAKVRKADGNLFSVQDFILGQDIIVYGRRFHLCDCDYATRKYLRKLDIPANAEMDVPLELYQTSKIEDWAKFHTKKNSNKKFMEAQLGNTVNNNGREGFNKYGNVALKFLCVWDNTDFLYGDRLQFALSYYLSDDTIEIYSVPTADGSKAGYSRLLKRSKLPKYGDMKPMGEDDPDEEYYHWKDFYIGLELEVYRRVLRITDCDPRTRSFYLDNDLELGPTEAPPSAPPLIHEREIPPPTAFGSEEDSLRSCQGSLMPGPAPAKKLGEDRKLSFFASLLSGGPDDVDRRFVITFFVQDGTLKIQEPPVRNSGFSGGVFLSRRAVKTETGDALTYRHLYVGKKLQVLKHRFLLLDANESTWRWMEDHRLSVSSFYDIVDKIRPVLIADARSGALASAFAAEEATPGSNFATVENFAAVLDRYGLLVEGSPLEVFKHEMCTILRANGNKSPTFNYRKLIEQIVSPTDEFK